MESLQWAIGILVTISLAVTGWLAQMVIVHERECKHVNARLATAEADAERMKQDIGTHGSGIRGAIHKQRGQIGVIAQQLDVLREKASLRPLDLAEAFRRDDE